MTIDLLTWLQNIPDYPKIFWAGSENKMVAGAGTTEPGKQRFGYRHFSDSKAAEWRDFPASFFTPRYIRKEIRAPTAYEPYQLCTQAIRHFPTKSQWIDQIQHALLAIEKKQLEKVVMARKVIIDSSTPINPFSLIHNLLQSQQTVFLIQPTPQSAFLGATPEILYRRNHRIIECDALAGTRALTDREELEYSEKDLREFLIVQNGIIEALSPLCNFPPTASKRSIRTTPHLCHLYSQIRGELKQDITDDHLLNALHPTPAVGGHPKKAALSFIAENEMFDRGLYASPIGWLDESRAEFAVGIRSCLIQGSQISLYAGTGIVAGSDPLKEWEESEHKLLHWNMFLK